MTDQHRSQEIAKIKIGQKELGLDDATYRAMLTSRTGHDSASKLNQQQRRAVLEHMKALGAFKDQPKRGRSPQARYIHALWKDLGAAGKLRNPSKEALRAFCGKVIDPDRDNVEYDPDFLDIHQASQVIETLKAMLKRAS